MRLVGAQLCESLVTLLTSDSTKTHANTQLCGSLATLLTANSTKKKENYESLATQLAPAMQKAYLTEISLASSLLSKIKEMLQALLSLAVDSRA